MSVLAVKHNTYNASLLVIESNRGQQFTVKYHSPKHGLQSFFIQLPPMRVAYNVVPYNGSYSISLSFDETVSSFHQAMVETDRKIIDSITADWLHMPKMPSEEVVLSKYKPIVKQKDEAFAPTISIKLDFTKCKCDGITPQNVTHRLQKGVFVEGLISPYFWSNTQFGIGLAWIAKSIQVVNAPTPTIISEDD